MKEWEKKEKKLALDILTQMADQFSGKDGASSFINHVLTEGEKVAIGRRIAVARMVLSGKTYFEVNELLSISPNTFRNVRKWLHEELPGFNDVLERNKKVEEEKALKRSKKYREPVQPFSFADLKRRYPMHFLLFNLADEIISHNQRKRTIKKLK
jgi:uncharacterized protein YerC